MNKSENKLKIVSNASWIIICKIVQSVVGIVISSLSARYLGPSNFGIINYAASIAAFMLPITQMGLNSVLVKELVDNPNEEGKTIGTALLMSLLSAFFSILSVYAFTSIINVGESTTILVCVLYSVMLIFQALELITYWFQTHFLSKYVSIASLISYVIVSLYKTYLLINQKNIVWFSVSYTIEYCLISIALLFLYKKLGGQSLKFSFGKSVKLISTSWPYIISGLMAVVYSQTDKVMLKIMVGDLEVGLYSAGASCITLVSFVFSAIIDSMRPYILDLKNKNEEQYEKSVTCLYSIVFYLSFSFCVFCFFFGKYIIAILYGQDYVNSVQILKLIVWYAVFNFYGGAQSVWFLAEKKQKYLTILGTSGALLNIILNLLLIPAFGASGAAIATIVTAVIANVVLCIVITPLKRTILLLLKAMNPLVIVSFFKKEE